MQKKAAAKTGTAKKPKKVTAKTGTASAGNKKTKIAKKAKKVKKTFKVGGFHAKAGAKAPPPQKKNGNLLNYIRTKCGLTFYEGRKSSDGLTQAYMAAFYDQLQTNESTQTKLQSLGIYHVRAGPDDNQHKEFPVGKDQIMIKEQQVACITGTNPNKVLKHAQLMAAIANKYTTTKTPIQQYPCRTHLGKDITPASGPVALDARLADDDVIALLQTAYPETELEDIQGNDKIMGQYFTCVHHGRDVVHSHITGEPLLYDQDLESAGEEEDDGSTDEDAEDDSGDEDADDSGSDDGDEDGEEEEAASDLDD